MSEYVTKRRYYLRERISSLMIDDGLAGVWRSKQEALPGTPLPTDFPYRAELAVMGYTMIEDLQGADAEELVFAANGRIGTTAARIVVNALELISPSPACDVP